MLGEHGRAESLGDSAPASAIVDGRFLRSENGKRTVTRRPDGGLDHVMTLAHTASFASILSAEEARALDLPGTRLTWRFLKDDGRSDWTFAVELVEPAKRPASPTEEEIVAKLYPDRAKLQKEEQRRFELLVAHWDVPLNRIDLSTRKPTR